MKHVTNLLWNLGRLAILAACVTAVGCGAPGGGGGGGTGGGGQTGEAGALSVDFSDVEGGNFAVAKDDQGNEYAIHTDDDGKVNEVNYRSVDGTEVKASLDSDGRPVKFRSTDNTNADITYDGTTAQVYYTVVDGEAPAGYSLTTMAATKRRASTNAREAGNDISQLQNGLETYAEIIDDLLDDDNPDNPLAGTPLEEAARRIAQIHGLYNIREVAGDELGNVDVDEIPEEVLALAGRTFTLFEGEGLCVEQTGILNELTFNNHGRLLTELDRGLVFPDFSMGGGSQGFTINFESLTSINLTAGMEGLGFSAWVTPVFTGTQLDMRGGITIERRFLAEIEFEVEFFTDTTARTEQLFNAALINGILNGDVLEFDLVLIDLAEETPIAELGRVRYHDKNSTPPEERLFPCDHHWGEGEDAANGLLCPPEAMPYEAFPVEFAARDREAELDYDWFVSNGFGYIENPADPIATVVPTAEGFIEITLIVSHLGSDPHAGSAEMGVAEVYICGVRVGDFKPPEHGDDVHFECPGDLLIGQPGFFGIGPGPGPGPVPGPGPGPVPLSPPPPYDEPPAQYPEEDYPEAEDWYGEGEEDWYDEEGEYYEDEYGEEDVEYLEWYVFGTSDFWIDRPFDPHTEITFFEPGHYEVGVELYMKNGEVFIFACEVFVSAGEFDECLENGWYGDGVCDPFCPRPDPDCEGEDWCEKEGLYGDGWCDPDCPRPDPDCDEFYDRCEEQGLYGDGVCNPECLFPDPDCEEFDECAEFGLYGDGKCDPFCPRPDPDCEQEGDWCEENGWYGDGVCDPDCPRPDPDCEPGGGGEDWCEQEGLYDNGVCDPGCPRPDPDCEPGGEDWCEQEGLYGNGVCDPDCPMPDPDCEPL